MVTVDEVSHKRFNDIVQLTKVFNGNISERYITTKMISATVVFIYRNAIKFFLDSRFKIRQEKSCVPKKERDKISIRYRIVERLFVDPRSNKLKLLDQIFEEFNNVWFPKEEQASRREAEIFFKKRR